MTDLYTAELRPMDWKPPDLGFFFASGFSGA